MSSREVKNLCRAIQKNDIKKVKSILVKNPKTALYPKRCSPLDLPLKVEEFTPLWLALFHGCEKITKLLIDFGACVDEVNYINIDGSIHGFTFLEFVPTFIKDKWVNIKEVLKILIKCGANINYSIMHPDVFYPTTALHRAIAYGRVDYAEFLLENGASFSKAPEWDNLTVVEVIITAPKSKQNKLLQLFIRYGLDLKGTVKTDKFTLDYLQFIIATTYSVDIDVLKMTKTLLNAGLPVNNFDNNGDSPLLMAIELQNTKLVSILINAGANVNIRSNEKSENSNEIFPLILASCHDNADIINLLISNGADINVKDEEEFTPLHQACYYRHEKIINILIQKGAYVCAEDLDDCTPFSNLLHMSMFGDPPVTESDYSCAKALVKAIAKVKFFNQKVSNTDMSIIQLEPLCKQLFETTMDELLEMTSKVKFYSSYSYYSVLKMSKNKLAKLTKNDEFVLNYEKNLHKVSYCESDLHKLLKEAIQVRDESLAVQSRLKSVFCDSLPDIVLRKLGDHLTEEELP